MVLGMVFGQDLGVFRVTRRGSGGVDVGGFEQRSRGWGSVVGPGGGVVVVRDSDGVGAFYCGGGVAARRLGEAVGGGVEEVGVLPGVVEKCRVYGELVFDGFGGLRETQAGGDPSIVGEQVARGLPKGGFVGVGVRAVRGRESKNYSRWVFPKLAGVSHHSLSPDAVVAGFVAGGSSVGEVRNILGGVASAMPGFDVSRKVRVLSLWRAAVPFFVLGFLAFLLMLGGVIFPVLGEFFGSWLWVPGCIALGFVGVGLGVGFGWVSSEVTRLRSSLVRGRVPVPSRGPVFVRKPRASSRERTHHTDSEGRSVFKERVVPELPGTYPLPKDGFMVAPHLVAGVVYPSEEAGGLRTKERNIPPACLSRVGPRVGDSLDGPVYLDVQDLRYGTAITGGPGTGKSVYVRREFDWYLLDKHVGSGVPGAPGAKNTLIAFENKGDGAGKYQLFPEYWGYDHHVIDVADAAGRNIDLFSVPGSVNQRAKFFVTALEYAFADGSIMYQSKEVFEAVFTAALAVNSLVLEYAGLGEISPVKLAHILCGGDGDMAGKELHAAMAQAYATTQDEELGVGLKALGILYGEGVTDSTRKGLIQAPRNKLAALLAVDHFFTKREDSLTWRQILEEHLTVIINFGAVEGEILESSTQQEMNSLLLFSLQNAIKRYAGNWFDEDRSITIFADELSLLEGSTSDVIVWFREQGRSYGIRVIFATQWVEQLEQKTQRSFLAYNTVVSFAQASPDSAQAIAAAVSGYPGEWSAEDIMHLPQYTAVVRTTSGERLPAFLITAKDHETDPSTFASDQGFTTTNASTYQPWVEDPYS